MKAACAALGRSRGFAPRQAAHSEARLGVTESSGSMTGEAPAVPPGAIPLRQATNRTPSEYMSAAGLGGPPLSRSGAAYGSTLCRGASGRALAR